MPVLGIHLDDSSTNILESAMAAAGGFELAGSLHQYFGEKDAALVRAIRERRPEVCIIDMDRDREMALETVEYLRRSTSSPMAIFAVSTSMNSDSIIEAMRSGCTEYLAKPLQADRLREALYQLNRKRRETLAPVEQGKLITVMGVKGGVGTTTLSVHLAYSLAKGGQRVLLIDNHPELGEATLHLGLEHHNYGFYELVCNLQRMDAELLQGFVLKHESGLDLLASPEALGATPNITVDAVLHTLRSLIRMYDFVVVDTDLALNERNMAVLESTDELYLISTPELPAIRNTSRYLDYLARLNYPASKIQVLLNRTVRNSAISLEHIEKVLRRKVSLTVPNSESEITEAIGTGVPVSVKSRSDFTQSMTKWVRKVTGEVEGAGSKTDSRAREPKSRYNVLRISG